MTTQIVVALVAAPELLTAHEGDVVDVSIAGGPQQRMRVERLTGTHAVLVTPD